MIAMAARQPIDPLKVMNQREVSVILADLEKKQRRSINARQNRVIFRLATCCGLRVSEIHGLTLADLRMVESPLHVWIRAETAKRRRARQVPLHLDRDTLTDLREWKQYRRDEMGANNTDPFVCCLTPGVLPATGDVRYGKPIPRQTIAARFKTAIKILGKQRTDYLTIHSGRHTFASLCLKNGVPLPTLQQWLGHARMSSTMIYCHMIPDDTDEIGDFFKFPIL